LYILYIRTEKFFNQSNVLFVIMYHTLSGNLEGIHEDVFQDLGHAHKVHYHGAEEDSSCHVDHAIKKTNHHNEPQTQCSPYQAVKR